MGWRIFVGFAGNIFTVYALVSSPALFPLFSDALPSLQLENPPYFGLILVLGPWLIWVYFFNETLRIRLFAAAAFLVYMALETLPIFLDASMFQASAYYIAITVGMVALIALITLHALPDDLVPMGRMLRIVIVCFAALSIYITYLALPKESVRPDWAYLMQYVGLSFLGVFAVWIYVFMHNAKLGIFRDPALGADEAPTLLRKSGVEPRVAHKLQTCMDDEIWREEGLTLSDLAARIGEPEYLVRKTINMGLGFQNFPQYLNSFRVRAAKGVLEDSHMDQIAIATLAFDLGFGSSATFTRVFKSSFGVGPSEYRRGVRAG